MESEIQAKAGIEARRGGGASGATGRVRDGELTLVPLFPLAQCWYRECLADDLSIVYLLVADSSALIPSARCRDRSSLDVSRRFSPSPVRRALTVFAGGRLTLLLPGPPNSPSPFSDDSGIIGSVISAEYTHFHDYFNSPNENQTGAIVSLFAGGCCQCPSLSLCSRSSLSHVGAIAERALSLSFSRSQSLELPPPGTLPTRLEGSARSSSERPSPPSDVRSRLLPSTSACSWPVDSSREWTLSTLPSSRRQLQPCR